jgi:uncharacterized protein (DUF934 family)
MYFLAQCGFDAFELLDDEDVATAVAQLDRFSGPTSPVQAASRTPGSASAPDPVILRGWFNSREVP